MNYRYNKLKSKAPEVFSIELERKGAKEIHGKDSDLPNQEKAENIVE